MIYILRTQTLIPGKMAEFTEINKEIAPITAKNGLKVAASFHGYTGNMNSLYSFFAYDDFASLQKIRVKLGEDKDYQRLFAKLNALSTSDTRTILEPNPWSPMK